MITPENTFAPQHHTIAARAQEIWESESRPAGRELDHWFRAERELLAATTTATPVTPPAKGRSRRKADPVGVSASAPSPAGASLRS